MFLWVSKCLNLNNLGSGANWKYILLDNTESRNTCGVFSLCDFGLIFLALFEVLCTLREISKRRCSNDMDQLSFCILSIKHGPQMEQKQTRVLNNRLLWTVPHYANLRRDCRELLHFTCVNLGCPKMFFHIIIVETTHFCRVLVLVLYRTYQNVL